MAAVMCGTDVTPGMPTTTMPTTTVAAANMASTMAAAGMPATTMPATTMAATCEGHVRFHRQAHKAKKCWHQKEFS